MRSGVERNPHAGEQFADEDAAVAAALAEANVPALLCSLVHMTGDRSWLDRWPLPQLASASNLHCGLGDDDQAEIRRQALPAVLAYRDGGCRPRPLADADVQAIMDFLAGKPVDGRMAAFLREDLQLDGDDPRAVDWADDVSADVRADAHVLVVGCGESGILAGIRLAQAGLPFTIVDANDGPGGTWWENRYPGARVDVGSHQYCYAFEPSAHWSEYYCRQPELRDYFARVVDEHGLRPHCRFGTTVRSLIWDDTTGCWRVRLRTADGGDEEVEARFVISAVGSLNLPKLPDIPGMDDFAGRSFHSARWPDDLELTGIRFALVGAGASGFQIAPTIVEEVAELTIYQRTAQWMFPNPVYRQAIPPGERWAHRHLPFYGRWYRFLTGYAGIATGTAPYHIDPDYPADDGGAVNAGNAVRRQQLEAWIRHGLDGHPDLLDKCIPDYPAMGKRILQDDGAWLHCLCQPNVELVRTGIERVVPEGIVTTDGVLRPADVICWATGFRHNDFLASMDVIGRNGVDLRERWGDEPTAHLGVTVPGFPNLFCIYGPGTNLAHSASLFFHSEFQVGHALQAIHLALANGARRVEVREAAHDAYAERHQAEISQLVWAHPTVTHSHYKNPDGRVFTLSPWSIDEYWEMTRHIDPSDYVLR